MENNTVQVQVEGMTCGNCALTISKILEKKGATNVSANAASGEVIFTPKLNTPPQQYFDAINGLGYKVQNTDAGPAHHDGHVHKPQSTLQRRLVICTIFTIPLLLHMFVNWPWIQNPYVQWALCTPVFIIGMITFLPSAFRSLKNGLPNMDVLIVIGAMAAYIYSIIGVLFYPAQVHDYMFFETAASIITLVMFGNWLEEKTVLSTTSAIRALSELQPQRARLIMRDSIGKENIFDVDSKDLKHGDWVLVAEGDSMPVDGVVVQGEAYIDEQMITGESTAVIKRVGSEVIGGTLVQNGTLRVEATNVGSASALNRIIRMVQEAQATKPPLQKLADKISAAFVPAVLIIALITFLVNHYVADISVAGSMMRAIAVLVISCPCALGLATPAAVAVGLGRAARMGILIKGGDTLERLKSIEQIVFDKTGTLTTGELAIGTFNTWNISEAQAQAVIVQLEQHSVHPIAQSIANLWYDHAGTHLTQIKEYKGKGMEGKDAEGNTWLLGSEKWLRPINSSVTGYDVYLLKNNELVAALTVVDELRPDAQATIATLKSKGFKTFLLSGDKPDKVRDVAQAVGIDDYYAEQSPEEKNKLIEQLNKAAPTAMVGDGINDAPSLANADVGISLSKASQIAIQSANIILTGNKLSTLPQALTLGKYTEQTIKQNLFWAFLYNIVAIPVAATGLLTPTWGAAAMALSDVVLILNSLRLRYRNLH